LVTVDCDHPQFSPHWPVVETIGEWVYFKPESGKLLASCGDETPWAPSDVQPDELDVAITIDRLEQATSLTVERIAARWAGLRTFAADRIPVVGRDTNIEDFFWLAGLGGFGIQTGPALGMLLAALVTGEELPRELAEQGIRPADFAASRLL
jgi:D-arginine dehydrogenase